MADFQFTANAKLDLQNIIDYTVKQWDDVQAFAYIDELEKQAQLLAENPGLGVARDSIFGAYELSLQKSYFVLH
ncbi:MAG TPA: hypothetical protein DD827_02970 [Gammaproteobacteria bacterium]|jgi:toxin ParE1/3/4|nr:hypothetical protein [Gammaproteobacteria bacterium]